MRRLFGHMRQVSQSPEGWIARCTCGWHALEMASGRAKRAYSDHLQEEIAKPDRECSTCREQKPREQMARHSPQICKPCVTDRVRQWAARNPERWAEQRRRSFLKTTFGITLEHFQELLEAQGGRCAICREEPRDPRGYSAQVDHCHQTGEVRGILCGLCNRGIGQFRDDPALLANAIQYLKAHQETG